jgi:hypothetical protein
VDSRGNYRINRCQHCNGSGFIRVRDRDDYKNTEKMSSSELSIIVREATRSADIPESVVVNDTPSVPEQFGPEATTLPDEWWVIRHIGAMKQRQWRALHLTLTLVLVVLSYVLGKQR